MRDDLEILAVKREPSEFEGFEQMMAAVLEDGKEELLENGKVQGKAYFKSDDGFDLIVDGSSMLSNDEDKNAWAEVLRFVSKEIKAVGSCVMFESWFTIPEKVEDPDALYLDIPPSMDPARKEAIIISAEWVGKKGRLLFLPFHREDARIVVEEVFSDSLSVTKSRFGGIVENDAEELD